MCDPFFEDCSQPEPAPEEPMAEEPMAEEGKMMDGDKMDHHDDDDMKMDMKPTGKDIM